MGVRWELEHNYLRIEPDDSVVAWNFKNVGDDVAEAGAEVCTVTVWKLPDGAPWTRAVTLPGSDPVAPEAGVPMSATLTWSGQEPGDYGVRIDFNDGSAMAETSFQIDLYGRLQRFQY